MADEPPWYRTNRGIAVVLLNAVLTLVGVAISTEPKPPFVHSLLNVSTTNGASTTIPQRSTSTASSALWRTPSRASSRSSSAGPPV